MKAEKSSKISQSVIVIIDDVKKGSLSRVAYFSIECKDPEPGWILEIKRKKYPVLMLGLSAVVTRPVKGSMTFRMSHYFEDLFDIVEADGNFIVNSNSIFMPNFLLDKPHRGDVYRVGLEVFSASLDYMAESLSLKDFTSICKKFSKTVTYSKSEANAFATWQQDQIVAAKKWYYDNRKKILT